MKKTYIKPECEQFNLEREDILAGSYTVDDGHGGTTKTEDGGDGDDWAAAKGDTGSNLWDD